MTRRTKTLRDGVDRSLAGISLVAAGWAFAYALYRAYYGFGGSFAMIGVPASDAEWRAINLVAAGLLVGAAVLPLVALPLWTRPWLRRVMLTVAWLIAVACVGHAVINGILRVLSLLGIHEVFYPPGFWQTSDRRAADIQDLLFNEPWFLVQGLLWGGIAWSVLGQTGARRWWTASAAAASALAALVGVLTAFGGIGRVLIG